MSSNLCFSRKCVYGGLSKFTTKKIYGVKSGVKMRQ